MQVDFRFNIGDLVVPVVGIAQARLACENGTHYTPNIAIVIERIAQECPGGIQLKYVVSSRELRTVLEHELAPLEAWDNAAALQLADSAKAAQWARQDAAWIARKEKEKEKAKAKEQST